MTHPPTYDFRELGAEAQKMARNCGSERMAMILQSVALGSMIIMAGAAAAHILKELFGRGDRQGRSP